MASFKSVILAGLPTLGEEFSGGFGGIAWIAPAVCNTRLKLQQAGKKARSWMELWSRQREAPQTIGAEGFHRALKENIFWKNGLVMDIRSGESFGTIVIEYLRNLTYD